VRTGIIVSLVVLAVTVSACGSSSSSGGGSSSSTAATTQSTTHLAKTKFLLHAGLAFGAIHRYIYKPYKQGKFTGGLLHHKLATLKAGLAAAFAYHEIRLALDDARSSKILSRLLSPLLALQTKLSSLRDGLQHGRVDPAAIEGTNSQTNTVSSASRAAGQNIQDQPTPTF
jgi:hypothetical protein